MARVWRAATVVTLVMASFGAVAASAVASSETLYVTSNANSGRVVPVPLSTLTPGTPIGSGVNDHPVAIAISPDASRAYTADDPASPANAVTYIDTSAGTANSRADLDFTSPGSIAVSPDGSQLYVGNVADTTVTVLNARDQTAPISVINVGGSEPKGIAFTPDGRFAYVATEATGRVFIINTASQTVLSTSISASDLPTAPCALAVTPDGTKIVVIGGCGVGNGGVGVIDTATNTVKTIAGDTDAYEAIAMSPDGTKAYAYDRTTGQVQVVDPRAGTPSVTPLTTTGLAGIEGIAVSPDGLALFATRSAANSVSIIDTTTGALSPTPISPLASPAATPWADAISPDQPPHAGLSVTAAPAGSASTLSAAGTTTYDGGPATYKWSFGDGSSSTTSTATVQHVYAAPSPKNKPYAASVTVTDDQGCSTRFVYTGQTASCNGGSSAVAAQNVTIIQARTLTVSVSGPGKVTGTGINCPGDCSQVYADGTRVTLTATPSAGSTFKGWGGACSGTGGCKLNMKAERSVSAKFGPSPPNTRITKARIVRRTAKFKFKAIGRANGFQCQLKRKGHKAKPFRGCTSPKLYKHLRAGKYRFRVRAVGPHGGHDPTPARKRFKVK